MWVVAYTGGLHSVHFVVPRHLGGRYRRMTYPMTEATQNTAGFISLVQWLAYIL
jgi:hypothetical protein